MTTAELLLVIALCGALLGGLVIIVRLYRSRQRLRHALVAMRAASQERMDRTAMVSHEMRTPLALIVGPVQLLLEGTMGDLTAQQKRFLTTIHNNARHLQEISEDILTHSRIEAGMFEMHEEQVDLRALSLRAIEELRMLHDLSIAFDCPGMPPVVRGDPRLLLQAVTNLLTNACRHSGGNLVVLRLQQQTVNTLISVDDQGIGMTRAQRAEAFDRYRTTAPDLGGIGLGMLITREIVRMHGSKLHIQSAPGVGTMMTFAVPNAEVTP